MMKLFASLVAATMISVTLGACSGEQESQDGTSANQKTVAPANPSETNADKPASVEAAPTSQSDTTSNQVVNPRPQSGSGGDTEAITGSDNQPAKAPAP